MNPACLILVFSVAVFCAARCQKENDQSLDAATPLTGQVLVANGQNNAASGTATISQLSATGRSTPLCTTQVQASLFTCYSSVPASDGGSGATSLTYWYVTFTPTSGSPTLINLVPITSSDPIVISSLGDILSQRAYQLFQSQNLWLASAIDAAQFQLSGALGNLPLPSPLLEQAFENATTSLATSLNIDPLQLAAALAQDFHSDGNFDGTDNGAGIAFPLVPLSPALWTTQVASQLNQQILTNPSYNSLSGAAVTLTATPALPTIENFLITSPINLSLSSNVEVAWTNALTPTYSLTLDTDPSCQSGAAQTINGITGTSYTFNGLNPGQQYYVSVTARSSDGLTAVAENTANGCVAFTVNGDARESQIKK